MAASASSNSIVQWYFYLQDDPRGLLPDGWHPYEPNLSMAVEQLFQHNQAQWLQGKAARQVVRLHASSGYQYEIDFQGMTQRNTQSGKKRPIARTENGLPPRSSPSTSSRRRAPHLPLFLLGRRSSSNSGVTSAVAAASTSVAAAATALRSTARMKIQFSKWKKKDEVEIPKKWKDLMRSYRYGGRDIAIIDIETFNKQWMEHPKKERFINWKHGSIANGGTMLQIAIWSGRLDIAKLLLEHGADLTIADNDGDTPLANASHRQYNEIVEILLDKGANINSVDKKGETALMWASRYGHTDTFQLLLDKGADINISNKHGDTALTLASKNGHMLIVKLLMEKGAANSELIGTLTPEEQWKELIENGLRIKQVSLETFNKIWMEHAKIEGFINWKDDDIADGRTMLICAIFNERFDIAKLLLEHGADINIADKWGWTAVMWASYKGCRDVVEILVDKGADPNIADKVGDTPLMCAASGGGHNNIVKLLVDKGADINMANKDRKTALVWAFEKGHADTVKLLLDKGADDSEIIGTLTEEWKELINNRWMGAIKKVDIELFHKQWMALPKKQRFINWKDHKIGNGMTMLLCAIEYGRLDIAILLLENGADITIKDNDGMTALMIASRWGHAELVGFLLDKGAKFKTANKHGMTALSLAFRNGHTKIVGLLMDKGADLNITDKERDTALMEALHQGHNGIVKLLVDEGADIKIGDKERDTALMKALQNGHAAIAELLIDKGADINMTDLYGNTALMIAFKGGHAELVKILLEKGADINIANKNGEALLMLASEWGRTSIVELLLEKGAADPNIADKNGKTALMHASSSGRTDTVELLVDKGADINIADKDGMTALMISFQEKHTVTAKLLLDKGADINIANKDGDTVFMKAFQGGRTEMMELLLDMGAEINIAEKDGWTVFVWAFQTGHTEVVKLLVDKCADLNIANKDDGNTVLIKAAIDGHAKIVEMFLDKGADCKITNNQGRTAFTEAYYHGQTTIVRLLLEKAPLKDIVHDIVKFPHFANQFLELYQENREIVHWLDDEGRTVRQMACKECREVILFMGQFDLDDQPVYESPTCKIYNALDYGNPDEPKLEQPRRVAMKFMEEVEHFLNEMRTRRNADGSARFSSEFVTPDLASYRADQDPEYAKECKAYLLPKFCLVMPRAERSLLEAMNAEYLSAKHKDLQRREILLSLCKIFSYLHELGYVHGDIKPHNVVRHMEGIVTWKAIDFDACTKIGDVVGLKLTTGSTPPEMLKIIKGEEAETESIFLQPGVDGLDESDLVLADASFDVWSFGILMYQLVTGGSFFHCDLQGNLVDAGLKELANLTEGDIHEKLESVDDVDLRVLLSKILRLDPKKRPTMAEVEQDYYFRPSEIPQGRKAKFFHKKGLDDKSKENPPSTLEANEATVEATDEDGDDNVEDLQRFLSAKSDFSYFSLRDEDKDWSDQLLNSEVETFSFDKLEGMGEKPKFIDGDCIYNNSFLRSLLSEKGPDYFMGFLVEYFELYTIMQDAHEVCQEIKANLVSDVKSLKGIFIKLFVRGKGLNDIVRGTLFCNSVDLFRYVGTQLKEKYGHNVYIKPPKQEVGAWPIPKLLIYGKNRIDGRCMSVEIQFSTVYMHLAVHASNNHLVYEAMRESTGYLGDKDEEFLEFLQSLNHQHIDTEGFLRNESAHEGHFEILVKKEDGNGSGESNEQYTTKETGFILSGRIRCGDRNFQFLRSKDDLQKFGESSFVVNKSLTLLSSHSYWTEESYDLEGKSVEFVVSFKGRGMAIAGIGTTKCFHGSMESEGGGARCSMHVARSKFVVRKNGVQEAFREKKLPNQEQATIRFTMKDGVLSVSFAESEREDDEEEIESVPVNMPSNQEYYLYMRAPPGVHDVKFHDINIV